MSFSEPIKVKNTIQYYFGNTSDNRKALFKEAITNAKKGKVVYILNEELNELPALSQNLENVNREYMMMISFLYAQSLSSLIESVSTLSQWQSVPSTIILDSLEAYSPKENIQNACGIVALLIDTASKCSEILNNHCRLVISVNRDNASEDYCTLLQEFHFRVQ